MYEVKITMEIRENGGKPVYEMLWFHFKKLEVWLALKITLEAFQSAYDESFVEMRRTGAKAEKAWLRKEHAD